MTFSLEMVNKPVRITDSGQQMGGVLAIPGFLSFFFLFYFNGFVKMKNTIILNIIANKS